MPRPIRALIDTQALDHNIHHLRQRLQLQGPQKEFMAVVKANAYGHGTTAVVRALGGADSLGLIDLKDAHLLRQAGWSKPIVLLEGPFCREDWAVIAELRLDAAVHMPSQLDDIQWALANGLRLSASRIFLKINTGMNRLGFPLGSVGQAHARLQSMQQARQIGELVFMTHYANADVTGNDAPLSIHTQWERLQTVLPKAARCSMGNSAALLNHPDLTGDIVRAGIAIYGAPAGPLAAEQEGLKPVMHLHSEVVGIQEVQAGEYVGYGSRYQTTAPGRIAVVACGYADGFPRHAPDGTPVWVDGVVCPLAGRVSMDMLTVDVSNVPGVSVGSAVELWGQHLPVETVAQACGTIGYELLCALAPRVPVQII